MRYEGYGPHGLAVVVDAATDNRNRTAGELRFLFSRHEGSLGETGSVGWMFDPVGIIEVDPGGKSEDAVMEEALVDGVEDIEYDAELAVIYTQPTMLAGVRDALRARRHKFQMRISACAPKNETRAAERQRAHGRAGLSRSARRT